MRIYSIIQAIYKSFYEKNFYKDVASNWKSVPFLYLLALLALTLIPSMFQMQSGLNNFMAKEFPKIAYQVPRIEISNGNVQTEVPMPYLIKVPDTGRVLIIIDTTGKINSLEGANAKMLLTKTKLMIQRRSMETRTYDLSNINSFVLDQTRIYRWSEIFRKWFIVVLYPVMIIALYFYRIIQALFYSIAGIIFAKTLKIKLSYASLVSLSIVSLTPVIIINEIYKFAGLRIPFWWLICFIIAMGYLYFAVKANREETGWQG